MIDGGGRQPPRASRADSAALGRIAGGVSASADHRGGRDGARGRRVRGGRAASGGGAAARPRACGTSPRRLRDRQRRFEQAARRSAADRRGHGGARCVRRTRDRAPCGRSGGGACARAALPSYGVRRRLSVARRTAGSAARDLRHGVGARGARPPWRERAHAREAVNREAVLLANARQSVSRGRSASRTQ